VQTSATRYQLESLYFADAEHGWVAGDNGTIVATADGGQHWQSQNSVRSVQLNSIHFFDAQHGWALGGDGVVIHTNNAGARWHTGDGADPIRYPAPWFWAESCVLLLVAGKAVRWNGAFK
jgi:photosystem II stability/assembly factor-like uncharacterized protein